MLTLDVDEDSSGLNYEKSVNIKKLNFGETVVSDLHVSNLYNSKHEDLLKSGHEYKNILVDDLYQGLKFKALLKKARMQGVHGICFNLFAIPLNFVRNYTIPMAEEDAWDRTRAAVTPITSPLAFMYLFGLLSDWDIEEG